MLFDQMERATHSATGSPYTSPAPPTLPIDSTEPTEPTESTEPTEKAEARLPTLAKEVALRSDAAEKLPPIDAQLNADSAEWAEAKDIRERCDFGSCLWGPGRVGGCEAAAASGDPYSGWGVLASGIGSPP
ncbi:hypothetical protein Kisp01_27940 [Kineosporia sp. NBRC 101677]|nr:hypothetical protein Kisp01_27940 [Kineosporia sp. NBRC 101677]